MYNVYIQLDIIINVMIVYEYFFGTRINVQPSIYKEKQVYILVSKNHALQMLCLKHYVYKTSISYRIMDNKLIKYMKI